MVSCTTKVLLILSVGNTARTIVTNVPSMAAQQMPWHEFCTRQNPDLYTLGPPACLPPPENSNGSYEEGVEELVERKQQIDLALDLLNHLMEPDSTKRFTPKQALSHPWLRMGLPENYDDEFFPHPTGEGVCKDMHFFDETDAHHIVVNSTQRYLVAGEGIAIGNSPCEFHQHMLSS